jgi:hypothetical protein
MKKTVLLVLLFLTSSARAQQVQNTFGIQWNANNAMAVSNANTGRIRYNSVTQQFEQSLNGAAYSGLGSTTLQGAYTNGGAGPQIIQYTQAGLGIRFLDSNPSVNGTLFQVSDQTQATLYFRINTNAAAVGPYMLKTPGSAANGAGFIFDTVNDYTSGINPFISFRNSGTEIGNFGVSSAGTISLTVASSATNTTGFTLTTNVADGATSIANVLNNTTAIPNGKDLSIQEAGIERFFVMAPTGTLTTFGGNHSTVISADAAGAGGYSIFFQNAGGTRLALDTTALFSFAQYATSLGEVGSEFGNALVRHYYGSTAAAPVASVGNAAQLGTGPTASCSGNDTSGTCTITSGTVPSTFAGGSAITAATVVFNVDYTSAPRVLIYAANANSAVSQSGATGIFFYADSASTTTHQFVIKAIDAGAGALAASTAYILYYFVIG